MNKFWRESLLKIPKTEVHVANSTLDVQNYVPLQAEISEIFWKL